MLIDGRKIAENIERSVTARVKALPFVPVFCDVLVGNDKVSLSYVQKKGQAAQRCGMEFTMAQFPEHISQEELCKALQGMGLQEHLCGCIVQLPLPPALDRQAVLDAIDPHIDVDVIGTFSSQAFYNGTAAIMPPTAAAVMEIISTLPENLQAGKYLVIGQGLLVGKPVAYLLRRAGKAVTVADKRTQNLAALVAEADVVITATGQPELIRGQMLKAGCAVIDAGTAELDGGIVGDVDFASVSTQAAYLTPVPGGVGPVTVAKLLENVMLVAEHAVRR